MSNLYSESGAISAGAAIGLALVAAAVYIGLAATNADTDHFGSMPVPGTATIELPKGETEIYYAQKTSAGSEFATPDALTFAVKDSSGLLIDIDPRGEEPKETDGGTAVLVGSVSIPADGIYSIEAGGAPASGAVEAELTFGRGPLNAVADRAKEIGESLIGPLGILILVALLILYYAPRLQQKSKKESDPYSEF